MDYKSKATECVDKFVMPEMRRQFEECGYSLDAQYKKYGNTEYFNARIIEPGHVYELGYPKCSCPDILSGKEHDVSLCECSRQSILYVLHNLVPDKEIAVEILHTVLGGAENCRFKATVK